MGFVRHNSLVLSFLKVAVYSLQVSPSLAGGLKPSWISATA